MGEDQNTTGGKGHRSGTVGDEPCTMIVTGLGRDADGEPARPLPLTPRHHERSTTMDNSTHYDVIVIGSAGGGSLAQRLAPTGKRILMLERGDYLPRSLQNWDSKAVFVDGIYQVKDTWYGKDGSTFQPGLHRYVGGNSKVYGSALLRLRERDFGEVRHHDGISPAWPLGYDVFEPYYGQAEALFQVRGQRGEDPNEPWSSTPYAHPPVRHEPRIQQLNDRLTSNGLHRSHLPLGILLDEKEGGGVTPSSPCIRCDAFDGFPCAINARRTRRSSASTPP